jgi:hypothetical protein
MTWMATSSLRRSCRVSTPPLPLLLLPPLPR